MSWTPRHTVNLILASIAGIAIAAFTLHDFGLDPTKVLAAKALATGLLFGLVTPGSPVGLGLDVLFGKQPASRGNAGPDEDDDDDDPTPTPTQTSTRPRRAGFAVIDALLCIVIAAAILVSTLLHGCGLTPRQMRLAAIETAAGTVGGAAELVRVAATSDAEACRRPVAEATPSFVLDEPCLAEVSTRWAPVDAAIDGLSLGLGVWLAVEAAGSGEATFPETIARMLGMYADLVSLLEPFHVELPPLVFGGGS